MKFTTQKDALRSAAERCKAIIHKSPMPILACVKITTTKGFVTLEATSLREEIRVVVAADVATQGSVCVDAAGFLTRVAAMADGVITVQHAKDKVTIGSTGKPRRFALEMMPAEDFPSMHEPDDGGVTLTTGTLDRLLSATRHAVMSDETRVALNCVKLTTDDGKIQAVATDGHRVSAIAVASDARLPETLIPLVTVNAIRAALDDDEFVSIATGQGRLFFTIGACRIAAAIPDGVMPPVVSMVPPLSENAFTVAREELAASVKAVAAVADAKSMGVVIELTDGHLRLSCGADLGTDTIDVEAENPNAAVKFGMHAPYLLAALASLDTETVRVSIAGVMDPLLLQPVDGKDAMRALVIMPMRI